MMKMEDEGKWEHYVLHSYASLVSSGFSIHLILLLFLIYIYIERYPLSLSSEFWDGEFMSGERDELIIKIKIPEEMTRSKVK